MSLSVALQNALSALHVNQRSLDVTAQNIANVNTEGYSRKLVHQHAVLLGGQGSGVDISAISRNVSETLLKDVRASLAQLGESRITDAYFGRMQDLFGAPGANSSIAARTATLGAAFEALAANPQDLSTQSEVISRAVQLVREIRSIGGSLQDLRAQADREIADAVARVNTELGRIQELNLKIAENRALGLETAELEDQRDRALNAISEEMAVNYYSRDNGELVIFTAQGRPLLDRTERTLEHTALSSFHAGIAYGEGNVDGIWAGGVDITSEIKSGRIGGLIQLRDHTLPDLHAQIGELTHALHGAVNGAHNSGTAYPGQFAMTGTRSLDAADAPPWAGQLRIATLDAQGVVTELADLDLGDYATVGALVAALDAMDNVEASLDGHGRLELRAIDGNRVALNERDSAVSLGGHAVGAAAFFGLNDVFTSAIGYDSYASAVRPSATAPLGMTGTLGIQAGAADVDIAYAAGDSLADLAAAINADADLGVAGVSARMVVEGSGHRLKIERADGANLFLTDSGGLLAAIAAGPRSASLVGDIDVRGDLAADPSLLARGVLDDAAGLGVGEVGLGAGDNRNAQAVADAFTAAQTFATVGGLPGGARTLPEYAAAIVGLNASQAAAASDAKESRAFLFETLQARAREISGVNLDEEMSNLILLQNAYGAAARVVSTTQEMFDMLSNMVRR